MYVCSCVYELVCFCVRVFVCDLCPPTLFLSQTLVTGYRSPLRRVQPRTPPHTDEATPHSHLNRHPPRGGGSQIGVDSGEQPEHSSPPSPSHHPQLSATSMDLARPKSAPNRRGRSRTPSPTALVPDSHCKYPRIVYMEHLKPINSYYKLHVRYRVV